VDVSRLVVPDHLSNFLGNISHAVESLQLTSARPPLFLMPPAAGAGEGLSGPSMMMVLDSYEFVLYSDGGEGTPRGSLEPMAYLSVVIPPTKMLCTSW
jgi:hypothetical protein